MIYNYKNQCTTFYNYLWKLHKSCAELRKVLDLNGEKCFWAKRKFTLSQGAETTERKIMSSVVVGVWKLMLNKSLFLYYWRLVMKV